jgi:3D (Asp-Asp-Asp) domain-containing protein
MVPLERQQAHLAKPLRPSPDGKATRGRWTVAFLVAASLYGGGGGQDVTAASVPESVDCSEPAGMAQCGQVHGLRATLYYTALERDYVQGSSAEFRDVSGNILRRGSEEFFQAASIEGSARFEDGQVLNYHRRIGGDVRWMNIDAELGLDARGCELVPFRSAAVDPAAVALGTVMLVEETRGMLLPDGSAHDGMWIAADTGDSILGDRIDLYTGAGMGSMVTPRSHGILHLQKLTSRTTGTAHDCGLP